MTTTPRSRALLLAAWSPLLAVGLWFALAWAAMDAIADAYEDEREAAGGDASLVGLVFVIIIVYAVLALVVLAIPTLVATVTRVEATRRTATIIGASLSAALGLCWAWGAFSSADTSSALYARGTLLSYAAALPAFLPALLTAWALRRRTPAPPSAHRVSTDARV